MTRRRQRSNASGTISSVDPSELARRFRVVARAKTEWEAAVDAVSDLVFLTDPEGRVLRCNVAARQALARPFDRILGRDLTELLRAALSLDELGLEPTKAEIRSPAGGPTYEYSKFPASHDGTCLGWVFVIRDVTELRRLQRLAARIDMMNNLGQVLSSVRHEIGNPANAMKTALTVMSESGREFSTEKMQSYVERCLSDVLRIQRLLERLRTFNLFEVSVEERVDLRELVETELPALRDYLDSREIGLNVTLPAQGRPIETTCDPRAVYQIILGLIANSTEAIEETDRAGRIRLDLVATGNSVRLSVSDNGPGIPQEHVAKVLLPLFTTKPEGTGLGLAIAHEMLTRMGGALEVGNDPELGGARIVIQLRLAKPERPDDRPRREASPTPSTA